VAEIACEGIAGAKAGSDWAGIESVHFFRLHPAATLLPMLIRAISAVLCAAHDLQRVTAPALYLARLLKLAPQVQV